MTEPSNARRDLDAEWLPRCCQAWIVEQTRPRGRRQRTERDQRDAPAKPLAVSTHGESLPVAATPPGLTYVTAARCGSNAAFFSM
jgi:hypothetical protein